MRGSRRGSALRTGTSALIRYERNELEYPNDIIQSEGKAQQNNRMVYRVFCVGSRFSVPIHAFPSLSTTLLSAHFEPLVGAGARCAVLLTARCVLRANRLKQTSQCNLRDLALGYGPS